jgi:heat shock protein HslJ
MKTLVVILLALVAMPACDEGPTSPSDPVGEVWLLASIGAGGTGPIVVPENERYTIQFFESGRVLVRADCNTCGGSYALTGTALSLGALACTRAFCGTTSLDGMFMQALGQTRSLARSGNELRLLGDGPVLRFLEQRAARPFRASFAAPRPRNERHRTDPDQMPMYAVGHVLAGPRR